MEGISFIVRVRNEEDVLETSLRSISGLTIPYDIHVILHMCTDRSRDIAESLQREGFPITIHTYDYPLSRAGYELLVTDKTSRHSMTEYTRFCYTKATLPWIFRWDADFEMTDSMREYLNSRSWNSRDKYTQIYIDAWNEDSKNGEYCLFTGPYSVDKYIFWEITSPVGEHEQSYAGEAHVNHLSVLKVKKSYWLEPPWFYNSDSEEAHILRKRYDALVAICGLDIPGAARRSNPECNNYQWNVQVNEEALKTYGIQFWF